MHIFTMLRTDPRRSRRSHEPVCLLAIFLLLLSAFGVVEGSGVKSVPETDSFSADPLPGALAGGNDLILSSESSKRREASFSSLSRDDRHDQVNLSLNEGQALTSFS
jgi:hypothetical protein